MTSLFFALLTALPLGARAQTLLSEKFAQPGLVAAPGLAASNWDTETGKLVAKGGTGSSDSRVLRILSRREDIKEAVVSFQLLTADLDAPSKDDERPWDGVHLWLRYRGDDSFYDLGVNRRDNTVVLKKKAPGPQGGSTFYTIGAPAPYAVPLNSWQAVRVAISDGPGACVTVKLYLDGALALSVVDDGSQGGAPLTQPGRLGLRGDNAALHLADLQAEALDASSALPMAAIAQASATVTGAQAMISWTTTEESDSAVDFGPTANYGAVALGNYGRSHAVLLTGLAPGAAYHYRVRSRGLRTQAQGADGTFTASAPLGVAGSSPTVSMAMPSQGQTLTGVAQVAASASDASGQVYVRFLVDAAPLGAELSMPPYSLNFNTALLASGAHTISAVARNAAGMTSVVTSSITIANGATVHAAASAAAQTLGAIQNVFTQPATAVSAPAAAAVPAGGDGPAAVVGSPSSVPFIVPDPTPTAITSAPAGGDGPAPSASGAAVSALAAAAADLARAPERFLSPALADGINDLAHFGTQAAEVSVFDIRGRRVYHAKRQGGLLTWNGRDFAGRIVESGVYIVKLIRDDGKAVYQSMAVAK